VKNMARPISKFCRLIRGFIRDHIGSSYLGDNRM
jgi:hypothetical protein